MTNFNRKDHDMLASQLAEELHATGSIAPREHALDVLNDYVWDAHPQAHLAWKGNTDLAGALALAEAASAAGTLSCHEQKLLDLAWEKVRSDADRAEWERLGGAR